MVNPVFERRGQRAFMGSANAFPAVPGARARDLGRAAAVQNPGGDVGFLRRIARAGQAQ
jgi:hypothetical protein